MSFDPKIPSADSESVSSKAEEYNSLFERLTGRSEEQIEEFSKTSTSFSDMLAEDIKSSGDINYAHWKEACMACVVAAEATEQWSESLDTYERKIVVLQYLAETVAPTLSNEVQVPYAQDNPPRQQYLQELQTQADEAWSDLEDDAEECSDHIKGGTDPDNVSSLMGGRLNWLPNNIMGDSMPIPVDGQQGREDAEELREMLESGEMDIETYNSLLATLTALSGRANWMEGRESELEGDELDYLEELFTELEKLENPSNGSQGSDGAISIPQILEDEFDWNPDENSLVQELGNGVLTLSNEHMGGGAGRLPDSIRNAALGPVLIGETDEMYHEGDYGTDLNNLGALLSNTTGDLEGGKTFSQHLTLSVGYLLNSMDAGTEELPMHASFNEAGEGTLEALAGVGGRNIEANHALLTGDYEHGRNIFYGQDWSDEYKSELLVEKALQGLMIHGDPADPLPDNVDDFEPTPHEAGGFTSVFDWMADDSVLSDENGHRMASEAVAGLTSFMADADNFDALKGDPTDDEDGISAEAASSLAEVFGGHLHSFAFDANLDASGINDNYTFSDPSYDDELNVIGMPAEDRLRFLEVVMTDEESAMSVHAETALYNHGQMILSIENGDQSIHANSAGNLSGLVDAAAHNEAAYRDLGDQEEQKQKQRMWEFASDMTLGIVTDAAPTKYVPGVNAVGNLSNDLLKDHFIAAPPPNELYESNGSLDADVLKRQMGLYYADRLVSEWSDNPENGTNPFFDSNGDPKTSTDDASGENEREEVEDALRELGILEGNSANPEGLDFSTSEAGQELNTNYNDDAKKIEANLESLIKNADINWMPEGVDPPNDPVEYIGSYSGSYEGRRDNVYEDLIIEPTRNEELDDAFERRDREYEEEREAREQEIEGERTAGTGK